MKVGEDHEKSTYTLIAHGAAEVDALRRVTAETKQGERLVYRSRHGFVLKFQVGGTPREDRQVDGNVTVVETVYDEGFEFTVAGSTEEDIDVIKGLRDMCFFGSGGVVLLESLEIEGQPAIVVTGLFCRECGAPMIGMGACESRICNACAAKCEHVYVKGAVHGGGIDIGVGEYCEKCGRGKPRDPDAVELTQAQRHLAAERELGITVLYKNTPLTPAEVDLAEKLAATPEN